MVKSSVADIVERRNESRRWYQINYWEEYEEAFRASKCLAKVITKKNRRGEDVEDTSRTNVAMPEMSLIRRRKTARLTANPPQINYTGVDKSVADKLSMLADMQFDRSGEQIEHRRLVDSTITFGRGITKVFEDTVEVSRILRKDRLKMMRDNPDEYQRMVGGKDVNQASGEGGEQNSEGINSGLNQQSASFDDDAISKAIAEQGPEVRGKVNVVKYSGPVVKNIFIGDFFDEPGCRSLNESGFAVENYWETDLWLQKMLKKTFVDPETDQEKPIFDRKVAEDLLGMGSWNPNQGSQQPYDLRTRLRTFVTNQTLPLFPLRLLPGKRFDILECHERDQYGQMWISWVGNERFLLGRMPYPWDLYGKSIYTEFVALPDIINAVGDSQLRLLRFLWNLHNAAAGSRRDLVNQILRPLMKQRLGADIPDEHIERALFRIIVMKDPNDLQPLMDNISGISSAIQSAHEEEAQVMRMIGMAEPSMTNVESGSETNPQAGKTATTAILSAKSADALTQFELDGLNQYLKELGEKKLWINQQIQEEPWTMDAKYGARIEGFSQRYGKTSSITLDPMEIQEDIQVEPVAGSMLSVDDDIKRTSAMQMYTLALQNPSDWNTKYCAQIVAGTIRGVDAEKAINQAPPQPPGPKMSVNLAVKYPELPAEAQVALLKEANLIQPGGIGEVETEFEGMMQNLQDADAGGSALANLDGPPMSEADHAALEAKSLPNQAAEVNG